MIIDRWDELPRFILSNFAEVGYITLGAYFPRKRSERQVSRFDIEGTDGDADIERWIDYPPDNLGGAAQTDEFLNTVGPPGQVKTDLSPEMIRAMGRTQTAFAKDLAERKEKAEAEEKAAKAKAAALKAPAGEPAEPVEEDEGVSFDDDEGVSFDDDEEEESIDDTDVGDGLDANDPDDEEYTLEDRLVALKNWAMLTMRHNTPPGGSSQFRIKVWTPKGARQLWSIILTCSLMDEVKVAPNENDKAMEKLMTNIDKMGAEAEASRPVTQEDLDEPPPLNSGPPLQRPPRHPVNPAAQQRLAQQMIPQMPQQQATPSALGQPLPAGLDDQIAQSWAAIFQGTRELVALTLDTANQLNRANGNALRQQGRALTDAREHNDDLLDTVVTQRLHESEVVANIQEQQLKETRNTSLGQQAIATAGEIGKLAVSKAMGVNPAAGNQQLEAPIESNKESPEFEGEPSGLVDYLDSRPDVSKALNTPSVRRYLKTAGAPEELCRLAETFGPGVPEQPAAPAALREPVIEDEDEFYEESGNPTEGDPNE